MSESSNTHAVKEAYAAFGRADINTILSLMDDHVEWEAVKGAEGVAPHAGLRRGRPAIGEFFKQLAENIAFDTFEPLEFVAQGDLVAVVGRYSGHVKPTKRPFSSDWIMVFTFRNGKVVRFREWTDSAQIVKSFGK